VTRGVPGGRRIIKNLRWWIGGLLFASTVINYIDRQTLSVLAPHLKTEFKWTNTDFALLVISFRVAYAVGQSAMGRLLDRMGTQRGLLFTVSWYSVAAMLTSLAGGLRSSSASGSFWAWAKRRTGRARRRQLPSGFLNTNGAGPWHCTTAGRPSAGPLRRCW